MRGLKLSYYCYILLYKEMYGDKSRGCTICEYLELTEGLTTY